MEGKLIKRKNGDYNLKISNSTFATTNQVLRKQNNIKELSLKNCQAIENGYDLDELAREACNITDPLRLDSQKYKQDPYFKIGFNKGFQKALELLGDKKFSSGQLLNAMDLVWQWMNGEDYGCKTLTEVQDKHIQSLQQTEWDVEIEMECPECKEYGYISECRDVCNKKFLQPKLDADGCLILKRK